MGRFFSSWATWEKLVFVLACAIVVTILLGCAKLGYTHWKLRKYTAVAEKIKRVQGVQRQMSQRRRAPASEDPDVPFGIRAIESGIEVDGVWISRNNTPEPASREQSASSCVWDHVPRKEYDLEKLEMQQFHDRSGSNSTTGTARLASSAFERAVATERIASNNTSREPSPEDLVAKPPKSKHPPSSLSKFSASPYLLRQDPAASTLQGIEAVFHASGPMRNDYSNGEYSSGSNESSNQSTYDSTDTEPISASAPRLLNQQPRPRNSSKDLDLMQSHRMSQAAETGQFAPRVRRPCHSGEWVSIATANGYSASEPGDYFGQPRSASPSPTDSSPSKGSPNSPLMSPKIEALPVAVRRSSLPDVTPFAKFCQTAPSPHPDGSRPTSAGVFPTSPLTTYSHDFYPSAPANTSAVANAVELPASSPPQKTLQPSEQPKRGSFEHRKSDVIRGYGSGFEIMRGSLFSHKPSDESAEKPSGPPISLHNGSSRQRSSSADSRKKLQKKRRPSADSHKSVETARGHRASVI